MSEAPEIKVPRIMIVDDDYELLKLISLLVRRIGAESKTFHDGLDALAYLESDIPDLIILDLMLPNMDGFEILRRIRSQSRFDAVPVLILSARADPITVRYGLENGADGYVTKPYIANSLIDRVRLLLSVGRQAPRQFDNRPDMPTNP